MKGAVPDGRVRRIGRVVNAAVHPHTEPESERMHLVRKCAQAAPISR